MLLLSPILPQRLPPRNLSPRNLSPRNLSPRNLSPRKLSPGRLPPRLHTLGAAVAVLVVLVSLCAATATAKHVPLPGYDNPSRMCWNYKTVCTTLKNRQDVADEVDEGLNAKGYCEADVKICDRKLTCDWVSSDIWTMCMRSVHFPQGNRKWSYTYCWFDTGFGRFQNQKSCKACPKDWPSLGYAMEDHRRINGKPHGKKNLDDAQVEVNGATSSSFSSLLLLGVQMMMMMMMMMVAM